MTTIYTKVAKAVGTTYTKVLEAAGVSANSGSPIGLLLALTYGSSGAAQYTKVPKATGTTYTKVPKGT